MLEGGPWPLMLSLLAHLLSLVIINYQKSNSLSAALLSTFASPFATNVLRWRGLHSEVIVWGSSS